MENNDRQQPYTGIDASNNFHPSELVRMGRLDPELSMKQLKAFAQTKAVNGEGI